jgi:hypothetical protein
MRSALNADGKLIPPASPESAMLRLKQLEHEISKIQKNVNDPGIRASYASVGEYARWRASARSAATYMQREADQLKSWLSEQAERDEGLSYDERAEIAKFWQE